MRTTFLFFIATFLSLTFSKAQSFNITTNLTSSCQDDGTLTVNFNNGTAPYNLTVYKSNALLFTSANIQTANYTLNNLPNGTYTVYANDVAHFFSSRQNLVVSSYFNAASIITPETCEGNAAINNTTSGGQAPYSYLWNNGASTQNITNVPSGRYNFKITDNLGCIFHSDSLIIPKNPAYDITFSKIDKSCTSKGSITATPAGGTAPYTFLWSSSPVQTSATASGLDEGMYTVRVTDNTGCSQTKSYFVLNTTNFNLNATKTNADCDQANGSIALNPLGGQAPYTYLWNNGQTTSTITGLLGNQNYSVAVTDNTNCTSNINYFYISKNSPLQISTTSTYANCTATGGGSVTALLRLYRMELLHMHTFGTTA